MLSASYDEDATPRCSGGQGGRICEQLGGSARSSRKYGEPIEGEENVATAKRHLENCAGIPIIRNILSDRR